MALAFSVFFSLASAGCSGVLHPVLFCHFDLSPPLPSICYTAELEGGVLGLSAEGLAPWLTLKWFLASGLAHMLLLD